MDEKKKNDGGGCGCFITGIFLLLLIMGFTIPEILVGTLSITIHVISFICGFIGL